jgi:hypothetical protein
MYEDAAESDLSSLDSFRMRDVYQGTLYSNTEVETGRGQVPRAILIQHISCNFLFSFGFRKGRGSTGSQNALVSRAAESHLFTSRFSVLYEV